MKYFKLFWNCSRGIISSYLWVGTFRSDECGALSRVSVECTNYCRSVNISSGEDLFLRGDVELAENIEISSRDVRVPDHITRRQQPQQNSVLHS